MSYNFRSSRERNLRALFAFIVLCCYIPSCFPNHIPPTKILHHPLSLLATVTIIRFSSPSREVSTLLTKSCVLRLDIIDRPPINNFPARVKTFVGTFCKHVVVFKFQCRLGPSCLDKVSDCPQVTEPKGNPKSSGFIAK